MQTITYTMDKQRRPIALHRELYSISSSNKMEKNMKNNACV